MISDLGITHALTRIAEDSDYFFNYDDKVAWITEFRDELFINIDKTRVQKEISEKHAASLLLFFGLGDD